MASKRRIRRKMCQGKKAYQTVEEASKDIYWMHSKDRNATRRLNVYKCRFCGQYHVGHESKEQKHNRLIKQNS